MKFFLKLFLLYASLNFTCIVSSPADGLKIVPRSKSSMGPKEQVLVVLDVDGHDPVERNVRDALQETVALSDQKSLANCKESKGSCACYAICCPILCGAALVGGVLSLATCCCCGKLCGWLDQVGDSLFIH